jgi:ribosomal protein S18 acetylase RimI-like enzyme
MAAAVVDDHIVGIASAVNYLHPDRPPELWVNEVGVAPAYRRQGVATRLLDALFELGRTLGCGEAWVLTEPTNEPALALYRSAGGQSAKQMLFAFQLPPR